MDMKKVKIEEKYCAGNADYSFVWKKNVFRKIP